MMASKKPAGAKALSQLEDALRAEQKLRIHHVTEHMRHSIRNMAMQADVIERAETNRKSASGRTAAGAKNLATFAKEKGYPGSVVRKKFLEAAEKKFQRDERTMERWLPFATQNNLLT